MTKLDLSRTRFINADLRRAMLFNEFESRKSGRGGIIKIRRQNSNTQLPLIKAVGTKSWIAAVSC